MKSRVLAPLAILLGGFAIAALLIATGSSVEPQPPEILAPLVRVIEVEPTTVVLNPDETRDGPVANSPTASPALDPRQAIRLARNMLSFVYIKILLLWIARFSLASKAIRVPFAKIDSCPWQLRPPAPLSA